MTERKETVNQSKIAFFDADKTIWTVVSQSEGDDYASKGAFDGVERTFVLEVEGRVKRLEDGTRLILKEGVTETFEKLAREGIILGIISDNIYEDVQNVCELLGIWEHFDKLFTNIRLWRGPADKALMISEVLSQSANSGSPKILLVDDSERYGAQMAEAGHGFIASPKDTFPKDSILEFFELT
jgi:phosphoglycolate phosphatase-like HAD superfamily hydrolase